VSTPPSRLARLVHWAVDSEASSRSSALVRIGLALLLWARWAGELVLSGGHSPDFLLFSCAFFAATTAMLLGVVSRLATLASAVGAFVLYGYGGYVLGRPGWAHHHTYLLALATLLCALTPCGRSYSLDRWLAVRRAERAGLRPPPERGNVWGLRLIAIQLSLVYFWAAFDKSHAVFLSGAALERLWLYLYWPQALPPGGLFHAAVLVASVGTVALEYALAFGLPWRRTRRWLLIPGLLFHGILYVAMPVRTFSLTMALLYLAYLDPDRVHGVLERMQGHALLATSSGIAAPGPRA